MKFMRRFWPHVVFAGLVIFGVVFWFRHDEILDWVATRGYEPSALVESLAEDTTMTAYAQRLFYVNRPVVQDKTTFNQSCTDPSEQVAVLGCFTGDRMGIFIYDVTDERLAGVEEVTAAHEMLHQAYQRLDKQERERVTRLLKSYYENGANAQLKSKLASYTDATPDELLNEMHSIFGTEAVTLPTELEEYYSQYFIDRGKVLALHARYQSEFDNRLAQIADYDDQLTALKAEIEANKTQIAQREADLHKQRAELDSLLANNRVTAYNAAVPGFNASVNTYRNLVNSTNAKVNQFNSTLEARNALAVQERELEAAIDSSIDSANRQ